MGFRGRSFGAAAYRMSQTAACCEQYSEALEVVFVSETDRVEELCPKCLATLKGGWRKIEGRFIEEDPRR